MRNDYILRSVEFTNAFTRIYSQFDDIKKLLNAPAVISAVEDFNKLQQDLASSLARSSAISLLTDVASAGLAIGELIKNCQSFHGLTSAVEGLGVEVLALRNRNVDALEKFDLIRDFSLIGRSTILLEQFSERIELDRSTCGCHCLFKCSYISPISDFVVCRTTEIFTHNRWDSLFE